MKIIIAFLLSFNCVVAMESNLPKINVHFNVTQLPTPQEAQELTSWITSKILQNPKALELFKDAKLSLMGDITIIFSDTYLWSACINTHTKEIILNPNFKIDTDTGLGLIDTKTPIKWTSTRLKIKSLGQIIWELSNAINPELKKIELTMFSFSSENDYAVEKSKAEYKSGVRCKEVLEYGVNNLDWHESILCQLAGVESLKNKDKNATNDLHLDEYRAEFLTTKIAKEMQHSVEGLIGELIALKDETAKITKGDTITCSLLCSNFIFLQNNRQVLSDEFMIKTNGILNHKLISLYKKCEREIDILIKEILENLEAARN